MFVLLNGFYYKLYNDVYLILFAFLVVKVFM
ncbi:Uncharacterised protein [Proteus penneri]|nr:Uncharacterised protein [Proteus penneri]